MSSPSLQIDVERRGHVFSSALPLEALQLVHGAIKLLVQMGFVAEEFVGCFRRWQAEASRLRVSCEVLA
jgi:hypothetical protein